MAGGRSCANKRVCRWRISALAIDVLWMRISRLPSDPGKLGHVEAGKMFIMIDREQYWQCAFVIPKGAADELRKRGIEHFREDIASLEPFLRDRVSELRNWNDMSLLTVKVDRFKQWWRCRPAVHRRRGARDVAGWGSGDQSGDSGRSRRGEYSGHEAGRGNSQRRRSCSSPAPPGISDSSHAEAAGSHTERSHPASPGQCAAAYVAVAAARHATLATAAAHPRPASSEWASSPEHVRTPDVREPSVRSEFITRFPEVQSRMNGVECGQFRKVNSCSDDGASDSCFWEPPCSRPTAKILWRAMPRRRRRGSMSSASTARCVTDWARAAEDADPT